jgi:hypothetical protein
VAWPLAAAASAGAAALVRFGYTFGTGDHLVLMPKGIALADPGAYANDWFVHHAPQPHWLFDVVTFLGERAGALSGAYLLWWLLSLVAFGVGAVWLARAVLPGRTWPAILLGPVLAAGPDKILGSTTPLLGIALPHMLGGTLAFAALAALLNRYWRAAAVCSVLAGLTHVQHGADLVPVLLLAAVLASGARASRRSRLELAGAATALLAGTVVVGWWRQIDNGGHGWLEVCRVAAPFHCDANSWTVPYLLSGALVVALALGLGIAHWRHWRQVLPVIGLPALGLLCAVVADRLDVPVFGPLAQRTNAYRLATLVVPFAALAVLAAARWAAQRGLAARLAFGALLLAWLSGPDAAFHLGEEHLRPSLLVPLVMTGLLAVVLLWVGGGGSPAPALVAALATVVAAQGGTYPTDPGYQRDDPVVAASLQLGRQLPTGAVVAAPPGLIWVRALTRRAVIADCKSVPYGGEQWTEYKARIAALGGRHCGPGSSNTGFGRLSPDDVGSLRDRFGATHVLLTGDDPKLDHARTHWKFVWRADPASRRFLEAGWWVFELPAV